MCVVRACIPWNRAVSTRSGNLSKLDYTHDHSHNVLASIQITDCKQLAPVRFSQSNTSVESDPLAEEQEWARQTERDILVDVEEGGGVEEEADVVGVTARRGVGGVDQRYRLGHHQPHHLAQRPSIAHHRPRPPHHPSVVRCVLNPSVAASLSLSLLSRMLVACCLLTYRSVVPLLV
jgi:hypothetical protein